jgi:hypothetical protein
VNYKHRAVLSSYSDLYKISSNVKIIHFRKFISRKLLRIVIEKCPNLEIISISRYASKRLNSNISKIILSRKIELIVSFEIGRPNNLKQRLYNYNVIL